MKRLLHESQYLYLKQLFHVCDDYKASKSMSAQTTGLFTTSVSSAGTDSFAPCSHGVLSPFSAAPRADQPGLDGKRGKNPTTQLVFPTISFLLQIT